MNIGIIGAGCMGKCHAKVYDKLDGVTLTAVCDSAPGKAEELAGEFGAHAAFNSLADMLASGIDMLDVCLPTFLHEQAVTEGLKGGVPVLCEKPFALDENSAQRMTALSKQSNVPLMIAHVLRFEPNYAFLKLCCDGHRYGSLKTLRLFRNTANPEWSESNWLHNEERSGGVALDLHIHDVDFAAWVFGMPGWVTSRVFDSAAHTMYGYDSFSLLSEASWRRGGGYTDEKGFDAHFEGAVLQLFGNELIVYADNGPFRLNARDFVDRAVYRSDDPYENEIAYFISCVKNRAPLSLCLPEDSLSSLRLALLEKESGRTARRIDIEPRR